MTGNKNDNFIFLRRADVIIFIFWNRWVDVEAGAVARGAEGDNDAAVGTGEGKRR